MKHPNTRSGSGKIPSYFRCLPADWVTGENTGYNYNDSFREKKPLALLIFYCVLTQYLH